MFQDLGDGTRRQNLYYLMKYVLGRKAKLVKIQGQKWSLGSFRNLPFQRNSLFFFPFIFYWCQRSVLRGRNEFLVWHTNFLIQNLSRKDWDTSTSLRNDFVHIFLEEDVVGAKSLNAALCWERNCGKCPVLGFVASVLCCVGWIQSAL